MLLNALGGISAKKTKPLIIGDSRRGLQDFPSIVFKMNSAELGILSGTKLSARLQTIERQAVELAKKNGRSVFVTMAERGILGAAANGKTSHQKALPVTGEIDIVGAGDSVTANLAAALAANANVEESITLANAAASIVVHQLGTTGTASISQISRALGLAPTG
jgi:bifunctional ADP-heptose synthase (sugar kinase/adenylyltransferase)